jgi:hypothetical protein
MDAGIKTKYHLDHVDFIEAPASYTIAITAVWVIQRLRACYRFDSESNISVGSASKADATEELAAVLLY